MTAATGNFEHGAFVVRPAVVGCAIYIPRAVHDQVSEGGAPIAAKGVQHGVAAAMVDFKDYAEAVRTAVIGRAIQISCAVYGQSSVRSASLGAEVKGAQYGVIATAVDFEHRADIVCTAFASRALPIACAVSGQS